LRKGALKALLVAFAVLAMASGAVLYLTHTVPLEEERTVPVLTYAQTGRFSCTARLRPDSVYQEATLTPEGGLFRASDVERVDVAFAYSFVVSEPANITVAYELNTTVASPAGWARTDVTVPGYVLSFDGLDDYVVVPASASLGPPSDPMTLVLRARPMRLGSAWGGIVDQGRSFRDNFWVMEHASEDKYIFGLGDGVEMWEQVTPLLERGTWYHLAFIFSSTNVSLYVDGVYVGSWGHGLVWRRSSRPLVIGCLNNLVGFGRVDFDEVRVYSRSLTELEIANDSDGRVVADGLALWLRFDGNAEDGSGNGNYGTVNGATWMLDGSVHARPGASPLVFTGTSTRSALSFSLDLTSYAAFAGAANQEMGVTAQDHTVIVTPQIRVVAEVGGRRIEESFKPVLEFKAQYGTEKGGVLSVEGLEHVSEGALTRTEVIRHMDVLAQRYASYALVAVSLFGLVLTAFLYSKGEAKEPEVVAEARPHRVAAEAKPPEVADEAKHLGVMAAVKATEAVPNVEEKPVQEGGMTVVGVMSFDDLLKVAEKLGKPLQSEEVSPAEREGDVTRVFYVVDGSVVYQYPGWLISRFSRETRTE